MTFFERYEALCREIGKTPTGVGNELGADGATVNYWKNGHIPTIKTLLKISDYFGVSVDYLVGKTEHREGYVITDAKVALFGGDQEVTDEMWDEVKQFVEWIKAKHGGNNEQS